MKEVCPHWSPARVALSWQVLDDDSDGKIGITYCFIIASEYIKDLIFELRRKIWRHDWSSQLYTQLKQFCEIKT